LSALQNRETHDESWTPADGRRKTVKAEVPVPQQGMLQDDHQAPVEKAASEEGEVVR